MGRQPVLGRRAVLRGLGLTAVGVGAVACGIPPARQSADKCVSTDLSGAQKALNFSNWPSYMDEAEEKVDGKTVLPTLEAFQKQTGIQVTYTADVNDNSEFYAKVRDQLGTCRPSGRDIFVLTDWMAARMVGLGWIQKLDHSNVPNVDKYLLEQLKSPSWDPRRDYSVPWQSGLTGIAYNAKVTGEVGSWADLLGKSELKGKVTMLSEMPDTMAIMLRLVGAAPGKFTDAEWSKALEKLEDAVGSGQIRRFTGNDYVQDLNDGNIAACMAWSGDVLALQADNEDIKFVVPEEGLNLWSDNMLVPNKATHRANAEALMNYYYDPQVAAELAAWVNYICPVEGAREAMEKIDPELVENPLIFPDQDMLAKTASFMPLDTAKAKLYETDFNLAIGG
ncbi:spermidine/putrescine ABC transporter substrate-binding protein [Kribbella sandramycini]|uniref:Spermidine/putrescine ABC transporter substrate-binding protein n=1 Tax=Kribbella sandramycini TaxID=60450 RepID=A0A7Y4L0A5_9ACTN|nr:spermidine/putrescine ABC transporter substrate-binding protein [Kribbella sandramycini]MBB6565669.1 spermidine/putrescine transport system substrate-binding protein [Kribbella sandramycini]NOL41932.1 spermidine/putrescine ABC transporter substrate-binding protein [Kribbella sandramycini]